MGASLDGRLSDAAVIRMLMVAYFLVTVRTPFLGGAH
jgi:hypothetical protein